MKVKDCTLIRPLHCRKGTTVDEAAKILRDNRQRRLIIVDSKDKPVGIVSTTDISNKVVAEDRKPSSVHVDDIMASPIYLVCDMEEDVNSIYKKMLDHESFFVPVTKAGKIYGILTYGELVRAVQEKVSDGKH